MADTKVYRNGGEIFIEQVGKPKEYFDSFDFDIKNGVIYLTDQSLNYPKKIQCTLAELQRQSGLLVGDLSACETYLASLKKGLYDVAVQDQSTDIYSVSFSNLLSETALTTATAINDKTIIVDDATDFVIGRYVTVYGILSNEVYFGYITNVVSTTITLTTPLDFAFSIGDYVSVGNTNMNVNGSVTPVVFGVRNPTLEDIPLVIDISRILFKMFLSSASDLSQFGNIIGGLTNGIVLRRRDGTTHNIITARTNGELKNICYDLELIAAKGGAQDAISGRFTFGGQEKLGAVVRLSEQEDLEIIIQDDLTSLVRFEVIAQGSAVLE